jgi:hypothetical protein
MHFPGFLAAALVATATALPTGEVRAQTQMQDPQVAGYGIHPAGQYHGVAQLGTYIEGW